MTKVEYRKIIWGLLKDYRDDPYMSLEKLLELIMAIPIPAERQKGKITFNRKREMSEKLRKQQIKNRANCGHNYYGKSQ